MEIRARDEEKGPVVAVVVALIALGLGSLFMTWQTIERQSSLVTEHLQLASRVVLQTVDSILIQHIRTHRMQGLEPMLEGISERLKESALTEDVVFAGLYRPDGSVLASTADAGAEPPLPPDASLAMAQGATWQFTGMYGETPVLFSAMPTNIPSGLFAQPEPPPDEDAGPALAEPGRGPGWGLGRGRGQGTGRGMGPGMMGGPPDGKPLYIMVGISTIKHNALSEQYQRAALLQTGYVFAVALLLWFLAFAYLRRREQGRQLVRLERFQSELLDNMPDGLIMVAPGGEIAAANGSARRLLCSREDEDLLGRDFAEFPFQADPHGGPGWEQHEFNGHYLELLSVPFQEDPEQGGDPATLVLVRDRTELKELEDDLGEAQRLATIGTLAAGVAHEIRNPLSSLRGFAQFFADKLKGKEPFEEYASTMVQEADRLNRVVTDLLYLARPRELAPAMVDLAALADDLKGLLRFELESLGIEPELDLEAARVFADPDALKQALLNLVVNALDAVRESGSEVRIVSEVAEGGVWVRVEDDGPGMSAEAKLRALEPFFTEKRKGTGLGLAIVHNIMRGHKGQVRIDSTPGHGTGIGLFFPASKA